MSVIRPRSLHSFMASIIVIASLLSACSAQPTAAVPTHEATSPASSTSTPLPEPSPTMDPARVIFVPGQGVQALAIKNGLQALAQSSSLEMELSPAFQADDLTSGVKAVVTEVQVPDFASLAAKFPAIQFIDLSGSSQPGQNLTVIGSTNQAAQQAFLAGYVAAISTPDYRVGMLSLPDAPGQAQRDAFLNGARYLCGICNPKYPPYSGYPVEATAVSSSDFSAAIADLKQKGVKTVFIPAALGSPEVYDALYAAGMQLIGPGLPAQTQQPGWLATISSDPLPVVKENWSMILSGKGGQAYPAALVISDVQGDTLTEGKMRLVQQVAADIQSGMIKVEAP